jgi:cytochrome P450
MQLRDVLLAAVSTAPESEMPPSAQVDILIHLSHATLDIIGLAGFNYAFDALSGKATELSESFQAVLNSTNGLPIFQILKSQIPLLRYILRWDRPSRNVQEAKKKLDRIGRSLVDKKKAEVAAEKATGEGGLRKSKDLLSLMIKSNMDETGAGLTDEEILHQIPTFLLAGTSFTISVLFSMTYHNSIRS